MPDPSAVQSDTSPQPHPLAGLPNALTTLRILSIPIIMWGILSLADIRGQGGGESWMQSALPIGLFVLAGITDFLDGFLARRWNVTSDFGRMIDPIADKLLVAGCLIAISIAAQGMWVCLVPATAIIFRDILVSGAREHAALSAKVMPPTQLAKWKTAFEMLAILLLILWVASTAWLPVDSFIPNLVTWTGGFGFACLWLAALLSVYTGSLYFRAALTK